MISKNEADDNSTITEKNMITESQRVDSNEIMIDGAGEKKDVIFRILCYISYYISEHITYVSSSRIVITFN